MLEPLPLNPILPKAEVFCCDDELGGTFSSLAP